MTSYKTWLLLVNEVYILRSCHGFRSLIQLTPKYRTIKETVIQNIKSKTVVCSDSETNALIWRDEVLTRK
jgi:hypothetical protein